MYLRKSPLFLLFFALLITLPKSCDKWSDEVKGDVEFYLLDSYETLENSCAIDNSSAVIRKKPLLAYSELKTYNSSTHVFAITEAAARVIEDQEYSVRGLAFAVAANDEVVYTGYFWPAYSSLSCQWIVIDPLMILGDNELHVQLGYPGHYDGADIPDERNNDLILDIFRRDGKLKK